MGPQPDWIENPVHFKCDSVLIITSLWAAQTLPVHPQGCPPIPSIAGDCFPSRNGLANGFVVIWIMDGCWMRLFIARRLLQYWVNEWMSESPLGAPRGLASPISNRICFSVKCWITNDCIRAVFVRLSARSQSGQPWPWDLPLSKANYHRLQCHLSSIHISSTHPLSCAPRLQRTARLDNTSQH